MATLKEILMMQGRSQEWLRVQLYLKGIKRDQSQVHRWCNNVSRPKDEYIIEMIAQILKVKKHVVKQCLEKDDNITF